MSVRVWVGALAVVAGVGCGGGKKADDGKIPTMPDPSVTTQTLRFVSTPVRAAAVGQPTRYRAVVSAPGETQYTLMRGPAAAHVDPGGIVSWTPGEEDSGVQTFVVRAVNGTQVATQEFQITAARRTPQAVATIDPADPNGGLVSVDAPVSRVRGAAVQMQPGALPPGQPVAVTISEVDNAPVPVAARVRQVPSSELRTVDLEPNGLTFAQPVRVYLPVTPMVAAMGMPEVQTYDYDRGRWDKVKVVGYDAAKRLVIAEVRHFSTYVVAPPAAVMALQANLGAASSSCADALVVRAPVTLGFGEMPASAVNGYAGSAATVADVLGEMQVGHALQLYTRVQAQSSSGAARGWVLASATKQADGRFKINVTSDRSTGSLLTAPAALAATDPELLAFWNGSRADVVLGGLGSLTAGASVQADASVYLVAAVDADRAPIEIANTLGSETLDATALEPLVGVDDDCDGAANAYDAVPNGEAAPLLSTMPSNPVRATVGAPRVLAVAANLSGTSFAWSASDASLALAPSTDGSSAAVTASAPGLYKVKVVATHGGTTSSAAWDVIAETAITSVANTAPIVKIAASSNVVRPDERVQLQAVGFDREQTDLAFTWSSSIPGVLGASGTLGVFAAREPGDYVITCVANDGLVDSAPATMTITVLSASANRPPSAPLVVPLSVALEHAAGVPVSVSLTASAVDPDGDAVTFDFVPDPTTPPAVTLAKAGASATVTTTADGAYVFYVTATDAKGAVSPWTPVKVLVLPTIAAGAVDADHDGYPAGFDCRDDDATIFPGARELCGDGVDQDCDGRDLPASSCDRDGDRISKDQGDCNDADPSVFPGSRERCDGKDNDCNGTTDDGFGIGKTCSVGFGSCAAAGTTVCAATYTSVVCSGTPGAPSAETCDGADNDCNGLVDDVSGGTASDPNSCGGCGIACAAATNAVAACVQGGCVTRCAAGFVDADRKPANGCECQVTNGGVEVCDGKDNDCNGSVDEMIVVPYYSGPAGSENVGLCSAGSQACVGGKLVVVRPDRVPGAELCDRLDNDCNGKVDETFDLSRDVRNCGACGNVCQIGAYCEAGVCKMQPAGSDGGVVVDRDASMPPQSDGGGSASGAALTVCQGPSGSYCTDLRYDHGNCGACGKACAATESCVDGTCKAFDVCPTGARFCPDPTGMPGKGACADLAFDSANCGGCGVMCGAMMVCDHGACVMGGGSTTCPATAPNVCKTPDGKLYCSDFGNDAANCGGCGLTCPAGTACSFGKCSGGTAGANDAGAGACPADLPNACRRSDGTVYCTDVKRDVGNCGGCGTACAAGASCVGGVCQGGTAPACSPSQQLCKDPAGIPICSDVMNDANNCGGCGRVCPAGVACSMGACGGTAQTACPASAPMQCAGAQGTFCSDPKTDPHNCGGCGVLCAAGSVCYDGRCDSTGACPSDRADVCRNPDGTAYCTSFRFDSSNCGGCGRLCPAGAACVEGVCGASPPPSTCPPSAPIQCKDPASGSTTCTDGKSDPHNCGGCGIVCAPGGVCYDGRCDATGVCPVDRSNVCRNPDGTAWCTSFRFDPQNCGACGKSCGGGTCNEGVCSAPMDPGTCSGPQSMQCKDRTGALFCTDARTDAHNCGVCGNVCQPGTMCIVGRCEVTTTCPPGAPSACKNPDDTAFCADFRSDPVNCGGCGRVCPTGASCVEYVCTTTPTTCPSQAPVMCMDPAGKPLCTNPSTDPQNCGRCGIVCGAGATCNNGVCSGGVCPVDRPNVCAIPGGGSVCTDVRSDAQNCGMCGAVCAPNVACIGGVCGGGGGTTCPATAPSTCQSATGAPYCTSFQTDPGNCGGCGKACAAGVGCQMGLCGGGGTAMCPTNLPNACSDARGSWRCTDVRRDSQNCGKCGFLCGSGQACSNGVCTAGTPMCEPPFSICSGGCTIFSDDPGHCGSCDVKCDGVCDDGKCAPPGPGKPFGACKLNLDCPAGTVCFSEEGMGWPGGACVPVCDPQRPCAAGQACVPAGASTGAFGTCRVKCAADADCGRDGTICAEGLCQADCRRSPKVCGPGLVCTATGACKPFEASCTAPTVFCRDASGAGYCSDTRYDNRNCGGCGMACATAEACRDGKCVNESTAGIPGTMVCSGATGAPMCVDVLHDAKNCGACGTACAVDQYCDGGRCVAPPSCQAPTISCRDPQKGYPYCTDPSRDSANCGGCGKVCAASSYCSDGVCIVAMSTGGTGGSTSGGSVSCPAGLRACDTGAGPYCADTYADPKNCGGCGAVCASGKCLNGACQ